MGGALALCCGTLIIIGGLYLLSGIRIVSEYERGVVFRLGRAQGARGPGLFFILPGFERMQVVDLRTVTLDVPPQDCITRDNVTVRVNAVVYYRVLDPVRAVVQIKNYNLGTAQIAQTTMRSVVGQVELDEVLAERERINDELQRIIDAATDPWGVKVSLVELKDVELPATIHAEGEMQAAVQLREAAVQMAQEPIALQLRYLQTLTEIAAEHNSTIIFPVPVDLLKALLGTDKKS
jgi:regulator of protease activity HflC (stomatin/prohibitin superfamily)